MVSYSFASLVMMERTHLHSHLRSNVRLVQSWCLHIILPSGFFGGSSARLKAWFLRVSPSSSCEEMSSDC